MFFYIVYLSLYEGFRNVNRKYLLCLRYGMEWYGMVWYGMVWYGMVWYAASQNFVLAHFLKKKVNSKLV
jgi:hypothetical protein